MVIDPEAYLASAGKRRIVEAAGTYLKDAKERWTSRYAARSKQWLLKNRTKAICFQVLSSAFSKVKPQELIMESSFYVDSTGQAWRDSWVYAMVQNYCRKRSVATNVYEKLDTETVQAYIDRMDTMVSPKVTFAYVARTVASKLRMSAEDFDKGYNPEKRIQEDGEHEAMTLRRS